MEWRSLIDNVAGVAFPPTGPSTVRGGKVPIAIIGVAGRYPQSSHIRQLWDQLLDGRHCVGNISATRWESSGGGIPSAAPSQDSEYDRRRWGAFIESAYCFDAIYFGLSPMDAASIDPQERLFLQCCCATVEDAGYSRERLSQYDVAVFAGVTKTGFELQGAAADSLTYTSFSSIANRVSYHLGLRGPSLPVDTMCSSSLAAIHLACEQIQIGNCQLAIAGGVNLYLHPSNFARLINLGLLSANPQSGPFCDAGGFTPGEGVGAVCLKRLDLAIEERDHIYATIQGTAMNQNGRTLAYMSPDVKQQAAAMEAALSKSGSRPESISYVELAANGSASGDAAELAALKRIFASDARPNVARAIGSLKANIGHSEAASGIAQITKVLLQMAQETIAPTHNAEKLNAIFEKHELPVRSHQLPAKWARLIVNQAPMPLRALVSNFGAGGVNVSIVLEEYRNHLNQLQQPSPAVLIPISALTDDRLGVYLKALDSYLQLNSQANITELAHTFQVGRDAMQCRVAIVASSVADIRLKISRYFSNDVGHDGLYKSSEISDTDLPRPQNHINESLHSHAYAWVSGERLDWLKWFPGPTSTIAGLPTYPFCERHCSRNANNPAVPAPAVPILESRVAEFYTLGADAYDKGLKSQYLTFAPFEARVPGFSQSRYFTNPNSDPALAELVHAKQVEMRKVLFDQENFAEVHRVLDIGCGHATDLIDFAVKHPQLSLDGFTITKSQADLCSRRIQEAGFTDRVKVYHADSSNHIFPAFYDLIFGIEVTFHIRNKFVLFKNISTSLVANGSLLLADYVANLRGAIIDSNIGISISTAHQWATLLAEHGMIVQSVIDVSSEIANFLFDPDVENNIHSLPVIARDTLRSYANQVTSLQENWISYCLIRITHAHTERSYEDRVAWNSHQLTHKKAYRDARLLVRNRLEPVPGGAGR
jgi:polyketide synthase PksM